jgi:hypothetical protein
VQMKGKNVTSKNNLATITFSNNDCDEAVRFIFEAAVKVHAHEYENEDLDAVRGRILSKLMVKFAHETLGEKTSDRLEQRELQRMDHEQNLFNEKMVGPHLPKQEI